MKASVLLGAVLDDASFVVERRGTLASAVHTPDACEWFHASADRASAEKLLQGLGKCIPDSPRS